MVVRTNSNPADINRPHWKILTYLYVPEVICFNFSKFSERIVRKILQNVTKSCDETNGRETDQSRGLTTPLVA